MKVKNRKIRDIIEKGTRVDSYKICHADKVWSGYSNDKVDIGEELAVVIRTLSKAFPLKKRLRSLSVGSSAEPQFRLLETAFRGGLYLLDLDEDALDIIKERIARQYTDHVTTINDDYTEVFLDQKRTKKFLDKELDGGKVDLITLHHSLYYTEKNTWRSMLENLYRIVLSGKGAMHIVLMSASDNDPHTTTWLYNHFVGKFFGYRNEQDLRKFKGELKSMVAFRNAEILTKTTCVKFFTDDFEKFMSVIWMILLYPEIHKYTKKQREEITEYVYSTFWSKKQPLIQAQDHMAIYRGLGFEGAL